MQGGAVSLFEFFEYLKRRLLDLLITSESGVSKQHGLELLFDVAVGVLEGPTQFVRLAAHDFTLIFLEGCLDLFILENPCATYRADAAGYLAPDHEL